MIGALPASRRLPADPAGWAIELEREPWQLELVWATPFGWWRPFGRLEVHGQLGDAADPPIRFEPLSTPPGSTTYPWVRRLRGPAYDGARVGCPTPPRRGNDDSSTPAPAEHDPTIVRNRRGR